MLMTKQQRRQLAAQARVMPVSLPAAIMGWNTRDALTAMDPSDAVILDNWYPDYGGLTLRKGFVAFASGLSGTVETLAEFYSFGTRKFLAASGGRIYDVSAGGAVGAPLASGFASNRWQTTNFNGKQFWVNGVDAPQIFDGVTFGAAGFTGPADVTKLIDVLVFKNRLFFTEANSQDFWYGGIDAITGALTKFPLGTVAQYGGNLLTISGMSHDGGDGIQEYALFIMTTGEILIYLGDDPSLASNWALGARYKIAQPVNRRSVCRYGAECYLTTYDDHVPLQQQLVALKLGSAPPRSKISGAVQKAIATNQAAFGWQALYYPKGRRLLMNIPNPDGTFSQHIYNTALNAWCRFVGMNASCWGLFNDDLYFGAAGKVYRADTGSIDLTQAINADGQQAWNVFEQNVRKRLTAVRPIVQSTGSINYAFNTGFDYQAFVVNNAISVGSGGSPWDTSPWNTSPWSPETQINTQWQIDGDSGQAVSFRLKVSGMQDIAWLRTDMRLEAGTAL